MHLSVGAAFAAPPIDHAVARVAAQPSPLGQSYRVSLAVEEAGKLHRSNGHTRRGSESISLLRPSGDPPDSFVMAPSGVGLGAVCVEECLVADFPKDARHDAGFQLEQVQPGLEPDDWKPMPAVGAGCRKIRIRTADGAFRVFYVTKFGDAVFVLHCFTKKSQKTAQSDVAIGTQRYSEARKQYEQERRARG